MESSKKKDYESKLLKMGIKISDAPKPRGAYLPALQVGDLLYTSGQGPLENGQWAYLGQVGKDLTTDEGYRAARICVINCLAAVKSIIGNLDSIDRIISLRGFINSAPGFFNQPSVLNGASEFLIDVFGESGKHVRSAIGTSILPFNIPVEVELLIKIKLI